MTEKILSRWVRLVIILIAISGVLSCSLWVPIRIGGWSFNGQQVAIKGVELWVQFVFHWIVSLPCFWILTVAWRITTDMKNDLLFTMENSVRVKHAAQELFVSVLVFLVGNVIFAILKWNSVLMTNCFVAVLGMVMSVLFAVLSYYLYRAAELQEECDGTI